ncbi:unnamed protein product, partial [Mesorhabditis belari]|uniref:Saposin B-type domain-containing protein n=1 Tax=Mesorhabditis belari TaxID=2138241 RepID=A0AAF3ENN4_9BILA
MRFFIVLLLATVLLLTHAKQDELEEEVEELTCSECEEDLAGVGGELKSLTKEKLKGYLLGKCAEDASEEACQKMYTTHKEDYEAVFNEVVQGAKDGKSAKQICRDVHDCSD